ncbi:coiled-coil domain-containing protein 40-like isoform X2 [Lineus longissimus]
MTVEGVVTGVTVAALQEFDTGHYSPEGQNEKSSRPPSGKPGSRPQSGRPTSVKSGSKAGSRPTSAASKPASRPTSAAQDQGSQKAGSVASGSHRGSAERLASGAGTPGGSRTGSMERLPSTTGSVRGSGSGTPEKPASVAGSERRSAAGTPEKAQSAAGSRRSSAGRPASAAGSAQGRPMSAASKGSVGSKKSGSAASQRGEEAPAGSRPVSATSEAAVEPTGSPASRSAMSAKSVRSGGSGRLGSGKPSSQQGDWPVEQEAPGGQEPEDEQDDFEPPAEPDYPIQDMVPSGDPGDGGGDSDGGDSGDDGGDYGDEGEEEEESDDGESELVVLDPDHPLMRRFQGALKKHLYKQQEKVTLELRELVEALTKKRKEREDTGVDLYGVQQELARYQMTLEGKHDEYTSVNQQKNQEEQQLAEVRSMYKQTQGHFNSEKKKTAELQQEVENLNLRIFYMHNAKEDVRSDIAVMRRAAEKAETEVAKSEIQKQKQDLFVDRLVERVDKLKEEIAMYDAQITAQSEETKVAKETLMEAQTEIEAINLEKKQLFQQWSSSLIGMRRRDEAHAAMNEALNQQQQMILSLETEIDGFKRQIGKEQEQNEKLTLILNKTEVDIAMVKKLLAQVQAKHEALKAEYATYTRMLHETEQALNRAMTDKQLRENEVNALRKQIEREYLEKVKLEDEIMEKIRSQLTMEKAAIYTDKLTGKMRGRTKELEAQVAQVENEISRYALDVSNTKSRIERLVKIFDGLDDEIRVKNESITKSENEIVRRNAIIERKQGIIDQFNKKLEQMITSAGGVEVGPLEIQINSLQKSIDARLSDIGELQQMWLREQSELVKLSKEKDVQSTDVERLKKQLTIISQKKIRIECEIDSQRNEMACIERNIRNMQNDMLKLNMLLHKEAGVNHDLQQENILTETDFIQSLKEAEKGSIEMQARLEELSEEKERLLNSLIEAERQIMLWEKKTQLAQETRAAVDSEVGQGEVRAMKAEIHRMQVRYAQLMRQQEKMIQEMEKAVSRRDTIVTRGDAQTKMNKKVITKGTFQRQLAETKKKIKNTIQDANSSDADIKDLREHQQTLSMELEERQVNCNQLQSSADTLDGDVERLMEQKQKNMSEIISKQQKAKYYQQVKDGKYIRLCKTDAGLDTETTKQTDRMYTLSTIVDKLNQEYPHIQTSLRKVSVALASRGVAEDTS